MKSINECLDILLQTLASNWNNYGNDRKNLNCEELMTRFGFDPEYRKHEFFIGLINKLSEDKYAEFIDENQRHEKDEITYYQQNSIITVLGWFFIQNGGYTQQHINDVAENNRLKSNERATLLLTVVLAIGALPVGLLAVADLYWKYSWFQSHFWWGVIIGVTIGSILTAYLIRRWWQKKQSKKR